MESTDEQKPAPAGYMLAAIVESSQDSIVTIDLDRNITSWNKGAENLYGYPAVEVIGKPLSLVMLPQDIGVLIENVIKITHEINVPIYETVRIHKNGKLADLEIALSPVRNAAGVVIGISTIARNITEAKLQDQIKDEFIAVASHELKTPVTSIKGYTQLLVEKFRDARDEVNLVLLAKLDKQVDRLVELINTLLDITKLSAGEMLLHTEQFEVSSLILELVEGLRLISPKHHILFDAAGACPTHADRKLIGRVINNLVSNAIKYSPNGGEILITARQDGAVTKVSVQDFGIGIPEGLAHKIFERYFRVNKSRESTTPGMGLGLYITAQIIHQHGGKLSVESREGIGSTFSFTLPATPAAMPA